MHGFKRLFRLRNVIVAGIGSTVAVSAGAFVYAQCSAQPPPPSSSWNPALPGNIPESQAGGWDYNWDL